MVTGLPIAEVMFTTVATGTTNAAARLGSEEPGSQRVTQQVAGRFTLALHHQPELGMHHQFEPLRRGE